MSGHSKFKILFLFLITTLFSIFFSSCRLKNDYKRYYLTRRLEWLEGAPDETLEQIKERAGEFKIMQTTQTLGLKKLLKNKDGYIWVRIHFRLPSNYVGKDLGLFICRIQSACEAWMNDYSIGSYGKMPPEGFSYGYGSICYYLPKGIMNYDEENVIYLKIWPGIQGCISDFMFISDKEDAELMTQMSTIVNSRVYILAIGILLFNFFFYMAMFIILKKYLNTMEYLDYAHLNLFSAIFLMPFCSSEFSIAFTNLMSYLTFLKFFYIFGAYASIYFASNFILHLIGVKLSKLEISVRNFIFTICYVSILTIRSTDTIWKTGTIFLILISVVLLHSLVVVFICLFKKEFRTRSIRLLAGFTPLIITLIIDFISKGLFDMYYMPYFAIYGWLLTIMFFAIQMIFSILHLFATNSKMKNELSELNNGLEETIKERTLELVEAGEKIDKTNKQLVSNICQLNKDLETAKIVQEGFMPSCDKRLMGWDMAIYYRPLEHVSGDMFDYYVRGQSLNGLGIFDVSGHGTSAGLITMLAKTIVEHAFREGNEKTTEEIMLSINKSIVEAKTATERYLTGLLFRFSKFDTNDKCYVEVSNAGHPYPLFYSAKKKTVTQIKPADNQNHFGFIGLDDENLAFPPVFFSMNVDDVLICFTDGVPQTLNQRGKAFGITAISSSVTASEGKSAKQILTDILDLLKHHAEDKPYQDDITVVVLKRNKSSDFIEEI